MSHGFEPGKLTEEVSTKLPDTTRLLLGRRAAAMGQNIAEYLRDLVCVDVHTAPYDELMLDHRRAVRASQASMQAISDAQVASVNAVTTGGVA